ncbi:MAG: glutamine--fructose-6-phosphate transaminase (isomerizing) [Terriglobales bacterium]|jgi:glucosamine--fructose-6-phosphate aminotransferase (isomerizing)|nr:glutamine--fructose-6-phosphate transaminase (isomerizing) [Terriglobales bacterium]
MPDKGAFPHYMLKEIFEQPQGLRDTIGPRISLEDAAIVLDDVRISAEELRALRRVNIVASGTSRHAGMAGQYMFQELADVPVDVDYASEFEYRNPQIGPGELTIVITQSGETADTTAAQREARIKGSRTVAISNVIDSTIAREADGVLYTHAGPEISIASTKAFTAQMAVLFVFALYLGQVRGRLKKEQRRKWIEELIELPNTLETVLRCSSDCEALAELLHEIQDFLFLGRAIHYPIAMDGALKLKEVSYVHAEGYPTGETKHGPNALIDENLPVVIIATRDNNDPGSLLRHQKSVANIKGFKQQRALVIAIISEGDEEIQKLADHTIVIPEAPELLLPILEIVPLQLFAYYMAVRKGLDVDRPRNLVKSVTVE